MILRQMACRLDTLSGLACGGECYILALEGLQPVTGILPMSRKLDRRAFLLGTVGASSALALISGGRPASAFVTERIPPQSALGVAYRDRCSIDPVHAQIMAKLEKNLAERTGTPGSSVSMTEYCPFCGCPIVATRRFD